MKVLLETPDFKFGVLAEPAKLSENGRLALEDPQNEILFSAASIWEIALKKRDWTNKFRVCSRPNRQSGKGKWLCRSLPFSYYPAVA